MKQSFNYPVLIAKSSIGKGIFAAIDLVKGSLVFTMQGRIMKGNYPWHFGKRWIQIACNEWIAPYENNPSYWINHSCDPNAGIKWSRNFVAMRDIKKGEEITYDYSTNVGEKEWRLECHCQNKNCRHMIRAYQFLPIRLKGRYRLFTSDYLREDKK